MYCPASESRCVRGIQSAVSPQERGSVARQGIRHCSSTVASTLSVCSGDWSQQCTERSPTAFTACRRNITVDIDGRDEKKCPRYKVTFKCECVAEKGGYKAAVIKRNLNTFAVIICKPSLNLPSRPSVCPTAAFCLSMPNIKMRMILCASG